MTTLRLSHTKTYILDSGGFFPVAETRELNSWMQGLTVKQAAEANHVSPDTVKTHRNALRSKSGKRSGMGVMAFCLAADFIRPAETYHTHCDLHPALIANAIGKGQRGARHG